MTSPVLTKAQRELSAELTAVFELIRQDVMKKLSQGAEEEWSLHHFETEISTL